MKGLIVEIFEASLKFGGPGHNGEYIVHVDDEETPYVTRRLQKILTGWNVCNRGSRIEIFSTVHGYGYRNDHEIVAALQQLVVEVKLRDPLRRFDLPMLVVLDQEHFDNTGQVRLVKCAVIKETHDSWIVKPVEAPYFDSAVDAELNTAFNMEWWRVSKSDRSAEKIDEGFDVNVLPLSVAHTMRHHFQDAWYSMCR
jgi:hypothetical protein